MCVSWLGLALISSALLLGVRCEVSTIVKTGTCVCANAALNGRLNASLTGPVVDGLAPKECVKTTGEIFTNDGYRWYGVKHFERNMWVAGKYLTASSASSCAVATCPPVVSRSSWGARRATRLSYLRLPVKYVFIHHTDGAPCSDRRSCDAQMRGIQNYHMDSRKWSDIAYNFLVGGDGKLYEGRGWDRIGGHTLNYNSVGIAFSYIGDFMHKSPTEAALSVVQRAIQCGVKNGKVSKYYTLRGHRDMGQTDCPGDTLYSIIRKWAHY